MAQDMVDEIEAAEEMAGSYGVNLSVNTSISNLIIVDSIANSDLKITVNAKVLFLTVYSYSMDFEVSFQKEDTGWKIISMLEKTWPLKATACTYTLHAIRYTLRCIL